MIVNPTDRIVLTEDVLKAMLNDITKAITDNSVKQIKTSKTGKTTTVTFVRADGTEEYFYIQDGEDGKNGSNGSTGPQGPEGKAATIEINSVSSGTTPSVTNSGTDTAAKLNFVLPKGDPGTTPTITVNSTTTGAAGSDAKVSNSGSNTAVKLDFTIPKGDKGDTPTIKAGTTTTGNAGTNANVTSSTSGTTTTFNFTIPKGADGAPGQSGPRGSIWNSGIDLTHTSGAAGYDRADNAIVGDMYLNPESGNVYRCTTAGNGTTAKWTYQGNLGGADLEALRKELAKKIETKQLVIADDTGTALKVNDHQIDIFANTEVKDSLIKINKTNNKMTVRVPIEVTSTSNIEGSSSASISGFGDISSNNKLGVNRSFAVSPGEMILGYYYNNGSKTPSATISWDKNFEDEGDNKAGSIRFQNKTNQFISNGDFGELKIITPDFKLRTLEGAEDLIRANDGAIKIRALKPNDYASHNAITVSNNDIRLVGDVLLKDNDENCAYLLDDASDDEIDFINDYLQNILIKLKRNNKKSATVIIGFAHKDEGEVDYLYSGATDASPVLQEAINSLSSNGGTIILREGTYVFKTPVTVGMEWAESIVIRGMGNASTVLDVSQDLTTLFYGSNEHYNNLTLENLCINAPKLKGYIYDGVTSNKTNDSITLNNCRINITTNGSHYADNYETAFQNIQRFSAINSIFTITAGASTDCFSLVETINDLASSNSSVFSNCYFTLNGQQGRIHISRTAMSLSDCNITVTNGNDSLHCCSLAGPGASIKGGFININQNPSNTLDGYGVPVYVGVRIVNTGQTGTVSTSVRFIGCTFRGITIPSTAISCVSI